MPEGDHHNWPYYACDSGMLATNSLDITGPSGHSSLDIMRRRPRSPEDPKAAALRAAGALHPHPEAVQDDAFPRHEFFDRRDRVQVKYEMLRRHRVDGRPVTEVAAGFGVSRQAFYTAEAAFSGQGIPGLLPRPRGPKRAHKCTDEILEFIARWRAGQEPDAGATVGEAVQRRFGVTIHPRSLARALARREKKRRRGASPP
jgi:transposase